MKKLLQMLLRGVGILLLVAALYQWASFNYPNISPFSPLSILSNLGGAFRQFLNFLLVCVLGSMGVLLLQFSAEKKVGKGAQDDATEESKKKSVDTKAS